MNEKEKELMSYLQQEYRKIQAPTNLSPEFVETNLNVVENQKK